MGVVGFLGGTGYGAAILGTMSINSAGVYGRYAGAFSGDVYVTGNLTATNYLTSSDRNLKENTAESTAFAVLYWLGLLDLMTDDYSFLYLLGYNSDPSTLPEFHQCLNSTQKIANYLITQLEQKGIKPIA